MSESTGKVGAVGYCFGGLMVNRLAASSPQLDAGVAYYGRQIPAAQVPDIKAALMLHYAENDDGVNAGIAAYEAALKANNKKYTLHMYPGAQHAFNNDTAGVRYNKAAADLAWGRTLAFFAENSGGATEGGITHTRMHATIAAASAPLLAAVAFFSISALHSSRRRAAPARNRRSKGRARRRR